MESLTYNSKLVVGITTAAGAAGTSDTVSSAAIDTAGFQGFIAEVAFGPIVSGAVTTFFITDCDTSGGSFANVAGTGISVADTDDNTVITSEIIRGAKRYIKINVTRATQNSTIGVGLVRLLHPNLTVTTQDTTVSHYEVSITPSDGSI